MTPIELADAFRAKLAGYLTAEELKAMDAANAAEADPSICHSHDFCDANVFMAEAFESLGGDELDLQAGEDVALVNEAWTLATRRRKRTHANQFPNEADAIEPEVVADLVRLGWDDTSWINDAMPSFSYPAGAEEYALRLWINSKKPEDRYETGPEGVRFGLAREEEGGLLAESEEWGPMLRLLESLYAIRPTA